LTLLLDGKLEKNEGGGFGLLINIILGSFVFEFLGISM
jgi:hypothetical protein